MLEGLMQHDHPLTLRHLLDRMATLYGDSEVVTQTADGRERATYAEVAGRAARLAGALRELGVGDGDRVATFSWNTQRHLEAYLTVPCMGAVLHTLNIRLFADQLTYIVNHAEDKVILVDAALAAPFAKLLPSFEGVEQVIVMGEDREGALPDALSYEKLLGAQDGEFAWPDVDDRAAAGLCYTSGTTGNPKGVLYSHRSNVLHALGQCLAIGMGLTTADRVLPVVPMFHANAWGMPFGSVLVGADMVMPGPHLQAEPLAQLIEEERVTVAGAVPTIWLDLLRYADEHQPDLSSVRLVACGGSAVPRSLMQAFEDRHGMRIVQAWGMTETSPLGSIAHPPVDAEGEEHWEHRATAGRPLPLVEARIMSGDDEQPWDGASTGELEVRGPWICSEYFRDPAGAEKFHDGWLRTGDVASIDERGYIRITDRAKDVIKSGGEWISSVDLENELMSHPAVAEAAVIAKPDERWAERPLACVVVQEGADAPSADDLAAHLRERVAKWWVPDEFAYIDEVPKTSVGKFDKKVLRRRLEEGGLEHREHVGAPVGS